MAEEKMKLKVRLAMLGKSQVELIPKINELLPNFKTNQCDLSRAFSDAGTTPKSEAIREAADKVLSAWENEKEV